MLGKHMHYGYKCPGCAADFKARYKKKQEKRLLKRIQKRKENNRWRKDERSLDD